MQFGLVVAKLGNENLYVYSLEGKGFVEQTNQILQDRVVTTDFTQKRNEIGRD